MWDTLLEVHCKMEVINEFKVLKLLLYNLGFNINYVVCEFKWGFNRLK